MSKPGPKKRPTRLKLLEGNPGKRPIEKAAVEPPASFPSPPDWLAEEARAEWERVTPDLQAMGHVAAIDRSLLIGYCEAWASYVEAQRVLAQEGLTETDHRGVVRKHPAHQISRDNLNMVYKLGAQLGIGPADRARMELPSMTEEADELLN